MSEWDVLYGIIKCDLCVIIHLYLQAGLHVAFYGEEMVVLQQMGMNNNDVVCTRETL